VASRDSSFPLPGYAVCRSSSAGRGGRVYEVAREHEGGRFVAWVWTFVDPLQRARVEYELEALRESTPAGVGVVHGVERVDDQLIVLVERADGIELLEYAGGQAITLGEFFSFALQVVELLARVHARVPVHGDLRPATIFIDPETRHVALGDLGLARVLESDRGHTREPEFVRTILPYAAPELVRAATLDSRSDLHALGVVFYELLTGRRPFVGSSASELGHALLVRRPRPPRELRRDLPRQLAAIVMKLLEKLPEQRYQSALGLHADLARLIETLGEGTAEPEFALGEHDYPTSLKMPQQLLGRADALARLQRCLAEVRERNETRLVFVTGEAGIGKTAILRALELPAGARSASGRFVDPARDPPIRGFAELLTELIGQVVDEGGARRAEWCEQLRERLGPLIEVLENLVPAFAELFGRPSSTPATHTSWGLIEVESRLQIAIRRFLATLAERGPIVLLLDDLQRADPGSLELLRALAGGAGGAVLIVAAASLPDRSSVVDAGPERALVELRRSLIDQRRAQEIELGPLALADVIAMLTGMLGRRPEQVRELAELLVARTGGNPLFVRNVLRELDQSGRLALGDRGWTWDLPAILAEPVPRDSFSLIHARLDRIAPEPRALLDRAACIGARFDLARLRAMVGSAVADELELARGLHALEQQGILVRVGDDYRFAHDRLHEQVLGQLDPNQRAGIHWQLAIALRRQIGKGPGPARFELADHVALGLAAAGQLDDEERRELVELEFGAGEQALRAAAWTNAERYLKAALDLIAPLEGERHSGHDERAFALRFAHAQALALCQRSREADEAFAQLLDADPSLAEFGRLVARRVQILVMEDRPALALEVGLVGLARCGQRPRPGALALAGALRRVRRVLRGSDLARFAAASARVRDERIDAALWILDAVQTPAFLLDRPLWTALCVRHLDLVLRHGFHATASIAFVQQAIVFAAMRESGVAGELAGLALVLAERGPAELRPRVECRARLFVWPYTRPFTELVVGIDGLFRQALDVGDRETAGYVVSLGLRSQLEAGLPLREVVALGQRALEELESSATIDQRIGMLASLRAAEALLGRTTVRLGLREAEGAGDVTKVGVVNATALVDWLLGRRAAAFKDLDRIAAGVQRAVFGTWLFARHALLHAIGAVEQFEREGRPAARARELIALVRGHRTRLHRQAECAPSNFAVMVELVDAELLRVRGRFDPALQAYESARVHADECDQAYVAGIAAERLADLATQMGQPVTAAGALRLARTTYTRWGAAAVVERLEHDHPELFGEGGLSDASLSVVGEFDWDVDAGAMLSTMQAISEELHLDQVIVRVLAAAIDHAGADRGVLLLECDGVLCVVAEGTPGSVSEYLDLPTPLSAARERVPLTVIETVLQTGKAVIFDEFDQHPGLADDPYFANHRVPSLLCTAIVQHGRSVGALLLEHDSAVQEFGFRQLEMLRSFAGQASAALDNARLYDALQRSEAQWRTVVGGVPDIIALIDERGLVEFVNHLEPFAAEPALAIGRSATMAFDDEVSIAGWSRALAAALAGAGPQALEVQVAPPGTAPRWYALRLAPIEVGGRVEKVITIATDIEDRKHGEADQARLEAQLRQQQRLESLGTLASGVAHEINNPIQGIMNYAELIAHRPAERELVEEFAAEIHHESERVATIVRNLLAFSRQEPDQHETESIAVSLLVDRMFSLARAVLRKDQIEVEVSLADDLPALRCRPQQVQQILMNLLTNARDALVTVAAVGPDRWIGLRAHAFVHEGATWIRMSIEDRGGGIDEAVLGRIFDPFFTTKGRDKGTGLGLAVSHGIAVEHRGRLWVDNQPGVGATFHLELPA
jgi:signal transduction histidine kinase